MVVEDRSQFFIGGAWVPPKTTELIEVISPITEKLLAVAPAGSPADIDAAVEAARRAFDAGPWPRLAPAERADAIDRLVAAIGSRAADLAMTITEENGSPLTFSELGQVGLATMALGSFARLARTFPFEEERPGLMSRARVIKEPVGVVGRDRAVERSTPEHHHEDGTGPGCRLHDGGQAVAPKLPWTATSLPNACWPPAFPMGWSTLCPPAARSVNIS